jgi:hypothetical protein
MVKDHKKEGRRFMISGIKLLIMRRRLWEQQGEGKGC